MIKRCSMLERLPVPKPRSAVARPRMHNLGRTRSANRRDHLLHTPDTFVRTVLPGMERGAAVVHISPAAGAAFTQYTAELEPGGTLGPTSDLSASSMCSAAPWTSRPAAASSRIDPGGYAYIPEGLAAHAHCAVGGPPGRHRKTIPAARRSRRARACSSATKPTSSSTALMGDPDLLVRSLLPDAARL